MNKTQKIFFENVRHERKRQNEKWGFPQHNSPSKWGSILAEETGELCKELNDYDNTGVYKENVYLEAIQVAAVACNIIEHIELMLKKYDADFDNMTLFITAPTIAEAEKAAHAREDHFTGKFIAVKEMQK